MKGGRRRKEERGCEKETEIIGARVAPHLAPFCPILSLLSFLPSPRESGHRPRGGWREGAKCPPSLCSSIVGEICRERKGTKKRRKGKEEKGGREGGGERKKEGRQGREEIRERETETNIG